MKCSLRRPICVVNLLLILFGFTFSSTLESLLEGKLKEEFGNSVKLESFRVYSQRTPTLKEVERVILRVQRNVPRASAELILKSGRRISVGLNLLWRYSVVVATRDISVGERLSPDKVKLEERFLRSITPDYKIDVSKIANYESLKTIYRGQILRKSYLKLSPVVKRGDEVRITYRKGNIEITLKAKALENGYVGRQIRLKLLNGRVIRGHVDASGRVVIR